MLPIALASWRHERLLWAFKEKVSHNPDADFTSSIEALAAEFRELENRRVNEAVFTLFLELYERDTKSLQIDLAKLAVFGAAKAKSSQRIELLRSLYGVVALYVDDFSKLLAMVEDT